MRIPGDFSKITNIYNNNKKIEKTNTTGSIKGKKDMVSLSNQAKDYQTALKAVRQCPDIREDKVRELEQKYANGTYNVTGKEIADKLIDKWYDKKI